MIVTKNNIRLLVGVLVIYCCIETTVGGSIRGVLHEDESTVAISTTSGPIQTEASDPSTSDSSVSPTNKTGRPKIHRRTSMMPHKKTTTTELPPSAKWE